MRSGDLVLDINVTGGGEGGGEEEYTVKSGDTLSKIGAHFGGNW